MSNQLPGYTSTWHRYQNTSGILLFRRKGNAQSFPHLITRVAENRCFSNALKVASGSLPNTSSQLELIVVLPYQINDACRWRLPVFKPKCPGLVRLWKEFWCVTCCSTHAPPCQWKEGGVLDKLITIFVFSTLCTHYVAGRVQSDLALDDVWGAFTAYLIFFFSTVCGKCNSRMLKCMGPSLYQLCRRLEYSFQLMFFPDFWG